MLGPYTTPATQSPYGMPGYGPAPMAPGVNPRTGYQSGDGRFTMMPDFDWLPPEHRMSLEYGDMFTKQFAPAYNFVGGQQAALQGAQSEIGNRGMAGATEIGTTGIGQAGALAQLGAQNNFAVGQQAVQGAADLGQSAMSGSASLGNAGLGLYGNLSQQEMGRQRFNSVAPVLQSLLSQAGFGQLAPMQQIGYSPIGGYQGAIGTAYDQFNATQNNAYNQHSGAVNSAYDAVGRSTGGGNNQIAGAMDAAYRNLGQFQNTAYGQNNAASRAFTNDFQNVFNAQAGLMPKMPDGFSDTQGPVLGGLAGGAVQPADEDAVRYEMEMIRYQQGRGPAPQQNTYNRDAWNRLSTAPRDYASQLAARQRLNELGKVEQQNRQYLPWQPQQDQMGNVNPPVRNQSGGITMPAPGYAANPQGGGAPPAQWETFSQPPSLAYRDDVLRHRGVSQNITPKPPQKNSATTSPYGRMMQQIASAAAPPTKSKRRTSGMGQGGGIHSSSRGFR